MAHGLTYGSVLSYWEHKILFPPDGVWILGAGITGLSTALGLKALKPELPVTVVDSGVAVGGATRRNAGFACIGSLSELLDDLQTASESEVFSLSAERFRGLQNLRHALGDAAIGYIPTGNYEIFFPEEKEVFEACKDRMDDINAAFKDLGLGDGAYRVAPAPPGLPSQAYYIFNHLEGVLDSAMLYQALLNLCHRENIRVWWGLDVEKYQEEEGAVRIWLHPRGEGKVRLLALCTNAFTQRLIPGLDVHPARGVVMVSQPLGKTENLSPAGFHHQGGYNYFRFVDGRFLIGGGRHLDLVRERTLSQELPEDICLYLTHLASRITGLQNLGFEFQWTGFMGKGRTKRPIVQALGARTFCAVRLGGMGVAIGYDTGCRLARLMAEAL
ncbi:MAG: FAD-binding oxidoreductase [Flavobacteriales bacterium]|nr:FAD-binding oxidoreductase [Flavobacteriales bacterium]